MVPCHGVTVTESLEGADSRDADWFLLDYQKGKDVPRALVGHIQGGLDELDADENSLLLFSGEPVTLHGMPRKACCSACLSKLSAKRKKQVAVALQQGPSTTKQENMTRFPTPSARPQSRASFRVCWLSLPTKVFVGAVTDDILLTSSLRIVIPAQPCTSVDDESAPRNVSTVNRSLSVCVFCSRSVGGALLVVGGKTRGPAGPKSEGESYFFVADHYDWWGKPDLRSRASTEDFARDSFENVLFSICRCVWRGAGRRV